MEGNNENEGGFPKGLIFGILIGAGVAWLSGTRSGQKVVQKLKAKLDEAFLEGGETIDDEDLEIGIESEQHPSSPFHRFFKKYKL